MHNALFGEYHKSELFNYYRSVKDRLIKDPDNNFGYHFSANDLYIYITAHEYKHYSRGGTGIRSLLDTYVIWQKLGDELNEDYIKAECTKLDISEFEQTNAGIYRLFRHLRHHSAQHRKQCTELRRRQKGQTKIHTEKPLYAVE